MDKEDIIRMAREAGCIPRRHPAYDNDVQVFATPDVLERFYQLAVAAERERIIAANAPEIEKVNAHIKALVKTIEDSKEYKRGYADAMNWKLQNHLEHLPSGLEAAVKAEREVCARVCEEQTQGASAWKEGAIACAAAIRARGQA